MNLPEPQQTHQHEISPQSRRKFVQIAAAGITFQGSSAAVDSATIMSALVHQLTGSPIAVGAVTAVLRFGWLFPQLFVGFLAQRGGSSMKYYVVGAFGRACCIALLSAVLLLRIGLVAHCAVNCCHVLMDGVRIH